MSGTTTASTTASSPQVPQCSSEQGSLTFVEMAADVGVIRLAVYLPPCATDRADRRYPTVYLLHGAGADETQWPAIGLVRSADELIAGREIVPVIVVMPSSGLELTDSSIVHDVIPWVDANLPTVAARADRAIGGISAGGAAAIRLVALNPALFSRLGGHSPVVDAGPSLLERLASWDGAIWLDVGESDGLRRSAEGLSATLSAAGSQPVLHVWPGQHDRAYWGMHVADYLRFYAAG
jgi:enterochelin esterase-like enzyme